MAESGIRLQRSTSSESTGAVQRQCACGTPTSSLETECEACKSEGMLNLQTRLAIGRPDDPLEHEADRAARQVMATAATSHVTHSNVPRLSRLQGSAAHGRTAVAPSAVEHTLNTPGEPLSESQRAFFEPRFMHDFAQVRIHKDDHADRSARSVNALAYTVGTHVVFRQGQFDPTSHGGRELLAHELAHVVQQSPQKTPSSVQRFEDDSVDVPLEEDDEALENAPIDMADPVVLITLGGGEVVFYTLSGRTFTGESHSDLPPGNYTLRVDFHQQIWRIQEDVPSGERFHVNGLNADPWALPYAGEVLLQVGAGSAPGVPQMSIDERIDKIRELLEGHTGGDDEKQLIALIQSVPPEQAAELLARLHADQLDGESLYQRLDDDVHGENNLFIHEALSLLRMKTLGSETGTAALADAPVIPWHDVMGFFETSVTFSVTALEGGRVRLEFHRGPMLKAGTEFDDELDALPFDMFVGGQTFEANDVIIIHDYDQGRFVPVTAGELVGYQHAGVRKLLADVGTIAQFAVPVSAARTVAGKFAVVALERILPAAVLLVDENRLNIARWFPSWGPAMIRYSDLVKTGLAAYGIASFAVSGFRIFQQWKRVRGSRASMDGPAPNSDAEQVALQMERHADGLISEAEKIRDAELAAGSTSPLDDLDLAHAADDIQRPPSAVDDLGAGPRHGEAPVDTPASPPRQRPGETPRPVREAPPDAPLSRVAPDPSAREAEVMQGISDETRAMLEQNPALKDSLIAHPHAAQALKLCNSPCYPDFATPEQIARLERLFIDEQALPLVADSTRSLAIRRFLHEQTNVDDLDRAIGILEGQLSDAAGGADLARMREIAADLAEAGLQGPDQARHALPQSSTIARNRPGQVSGGRGLTDVADEWFPNNPTTGAAARVAPIPGQIARKLRRIGHFRSFREFRETFWQLVANDPVLGRAATNGQSGWSAQNLSRMRQGHAPWAPTGQATGGGANAKWQLNHKQAITSEGGVYDLDNIEVVTPWFHQGIGD